MSPIHRESVLNALARRIGRDKGIAGRDLVIDICGAWSARHERELRHVIEALRMEGIAVCGHPGTGYFIAATADEVQESIRFLRSRALTSLRQLRAMRRAAVSINGQGRLLL